MKVNRVRQFQFVPAYRKKKEIRENRKQENQGICGFSILLAHFRAVTVIKKQILKDFSNITNEVVERFYVNIERELVTFEKKHEWKYSKVNFNIRNGSIQIYFIEFLAFLLDNY